MTRNTVLAGLAATVAAISIAAPAQAQEVIAPAPTVTPAPSANPAQPTSPNAGATVTFGDCVVAHSSHGYTYAVCSVIADNVPYGQTVTVGYRSNLKTFKPRTPVKWGTQAGTIRLTNNMPGLTSGSPSNVIGSVKLAFQGKTVAQVRQQLIVGSTGSNAELIQPIATTV
jgi:hypothetical protein